MIADLFESAGAWVQNLLHRCLPSNRMRKEYEAFIEWEQCKCGCQPDTGTVRLFEKNYTSLAPDGMPDAAWVWMCVIKVKGPVILVKAALVSPPLDGVPTMLALGRSLGCRQLHWERLKGGKLKLRVHELFSANNEIFSQ